MKRQELLSLIGALILTITIPLTLLLVGQRQIFEKRAFVSGGAASLSLLPASGTFAPGDDLDININLNTGGEEVYGFEITLTFDSSVLEARETEVDTAGADLSFPLVFKNNISGGKAEFHASISPGTSYINGAGSIGTLKLRVRGDASLGETSLDFVPSGGDQCAVYNRGIADILGAAPEGVYTIGTAEECEVDGDCDDGNLCTTDRCVDGVCAYELVSCGSNAHCDSATGDCVCDNSYGDCNEDLEEEGSDGCEVNLMTDEANCNSCGNQCAAEELCQSGECVFPDGPVLTFQVQLEGRHGKHPAKVKLLVKQDGQEVIDETVEIDENGSAQIDLRTDGGDWLPSGAYETFVKGPQHLRKEKTLIIEEGVSDYSLDFGRALAGDISGLGGGEGDNRIDSFDIVFWQTEWNPRQDVESRADINLDLRVNVADSAYIYKNFWEEGDN